MRIKKLSCYSGMLMRLPEETHARKALQEAIKPEKLKQGRPTLTWWPTLKRPILSPKSGLKQTSASTPYPGRNM